MPVNFPRIAPPKAKPIAGTKMGQSPICTIDGQVNKIAPNNAKAITIPILPSRQPHGKTSRPVLTPSTPSLSVLRPAEIPSASVATSEVGAVGVRAPAAAPGGGGGGGGRSSENL